VEGGEGRDAEQRAGPRERVRGALDDAGGVDDVPRVEPVDEADVDAERDDEAEDGRPREESAAPCAKLPFDGPEREREREDAEERVADVEGARDGGQEHARAVGLAPRAPRREGLVEEEVAPLRHEIGRVRQEGEPHDAEEQRPGAESSRRRASEEEPDDRRHGRQREVHRRLGEELLQHRARLRKEAGPASRGGRPRVSHPSAGATRPSERAASTRR